MNTGRNWTILWPILMETTIVASFEGLAPFSVIGSSQVESVVWRNLFGYIGMKSKSSYEADSLEIDLRVCEEAMKRLFAHARKRVGGSLVSIDCSYYWDVVSPERYKMDKAPDLAVGDLSDDIIELSHVTENEGDIIAYQLVNAAAVLRAVGEKLVS